MKNLSSAQINAVVMKVTGQYRDKIAQLVNKRNKETKAARKAALEKLFSHLTAKQRKQVINGLGYTTIAGVPDYDKWNQQDESTTFNKAIEDLRFSLVMANNDTYQEHVKKFEAQIGKLFK